jgi:hypothetical protein
VNFAIGGRGGIYDSGERFPSASGTFRVDVGGLVGWGSIEGFAYAILPLFPMASNSPWGV